MPTDPGRGWSALGAGHRGGGPAVAVDLARRGAADGEGEVRVDLAGLRAELGYGLVQLVPALPPDIRIAQLPL